ncbi:MAG TPA: carboxypeptidase-like regulatory domain-containing protein [Terriglobales bacterium]|nr:carboxypeptidase-like regulatory domain-containing protein [Terriglobales bacterium]
MKSINLGWLAIVLAVAVPAGATARTATISGYVRDSQGTAQLGAIVQVLGATAANVLTVFTDDNGFYSAGQLNPGVYHVKVKAPSFLPSLRENISLRAGANRVVNVTLNTIFEAMQTLPLRPGPTQEDDWKWTLRSAANRPILRVLDNGPLTVVSEKVNDADLKARVAFVAGSGADGFNAGRTVFSLEHSLFSDGKLSFNGNVGYGVGSPTTVWRASYSHQMATGSRPQVSFTMRRLAAPDAGLHDTALQALTLSVSDGFTLGDVLDLDFGSELQTIQFMGRVSAAHPFGSADLHLSPNTVLEYRYATTEPNTRMEKGFDSAPADLSESGPRVSVTGGSPALERAHHHELSISHRSRETNLQAAVFADRILNTALTGIGNPNAELEDVLPDVYAQTFTYKGRELRSTGVRLVAQRQLASGITGTLDYAYGSVLSAAPGSQWHSLPTALHTEGRHAVTTKVSGTAPLSKTRWITSYKWTSGEALTPVDLFNTSAGQADPYWSIFIRQPIPGTIFNSGHMEALLEIRNLLAEGYVPVFGQDGHTLYLVQAPRSLRGGVAFTF